MYTAYYGLAGRPFQLSPDPRFFFGSRGHRRAMAYLTYGLRQAEGFMVITGEVGTGKTMLIEYLRANLPRERFLAPTIGAARLDAPDLLSTLAAALDLPEPTRPPAVLRGALSRFLLDCAHHRRRVLLIVDEAQNLTPDALEELRLLSNHQAGGRTPLQVLLVAQSRFRDMLAEPRFEQLRQRVVASHHLGPLDADETRAYIRHRLACVGWRDNPTFTDAACAAIHRETEGVPRRINLLCARLLVLGALERRHEIDAGAVAEIARELEDEHAPPEAAAAPASPERAETAEASPPDREVEHWRSEVERLQRKLEQAFDDLSGERRRVDAIRAEAEELRAELHRIELERLRVDAETSRRAIEILSEPAGGRARGLLRRFAGRPG